VLGSLDLSIGDGGARERIVEMMMMGVGRGGGTYHLICALCFV
jgi:hypothetical protein